MLSEHPDQRAPNAGQAGTGLGGCDSRHQRLYDAIAALVIQPHSRGRWTYVIACTFHLVSGLRTLGFYGYLQPSRSYLGQQIFLLNMQRCGGNYWRPDKSEFVPPTN